MTEKRKVEEAWRIWRRLEADYRRAWASDNWQQREYTAGVVQGALEMMALMLPREGAKMAESIKDVAAGSR